MKKTLFVLLLCCMALLLFFSRTALQAAKEALSIWAGQVVPALLPFFICTDMLRRLGMRQRGALPFFFMSMLSGAPSGARLCSAYDHGDGAYTALVAACNVIGPMFVSGAYCVGMLQTPKLAIPLLLSQYASALLMLYRCRRSLPALSTEAAPMQAASAALSASIYDGVLSMLSIGGVILSYRVLLSLIGALWAASKLQPPPPLLAAMLTGMLEVVNGCAQLSAIPLSARQMAALSAFLFSFGGVCVMTQSMQFYTLLPWRYLLNKLQQGLFAALFAYCTTPLFLANTQEVIYTLDMYKLKQNTLSSLSVFLISSFSMLVVWVCCAAVRRPQK